MGFHSFSNMYAFELLPKLNNLVLAGKEDGELVWIGTNEQWNRSEYEMDSTLVNMVGMLELANANY